MKDTGERLIPKVHIGKLMYGEHMARYILSAELVKDKYVLDIASGTGYGTYILAEKAKNVKGVDISKKAVVYAKKNFNRKNLEFIQASADKIPFDDGTFDVVNSFETIEHITTYREFVEEAKRVLKKEGLFIVSTPNKNEFMENNHFHVHEFNEKEFVSLLNKYFKNVSIYYQETFKGSSIHDSSYFSGKWSENQKVVNLLAQKKDKAIYYIAVCSDGKLPHYGEINVISENWSDKKNLRDLSINKAAHERASRLNETEYKLKMLENELYKIKSSIFWKLTEPLRAIKKIIKK